MTGQTPIRFADRQYWSHMRTSTGTRGVRLTAAAVVVLLLGSCGRPAPADEAQTAAPDPAAQSTTPASDTVDAAVPSNEDDQGAQQQADAMTGQDDGDGTAMADGATEGGADTGQTAAATPATAPVLTADQVVGVVDPTPDMAGVKITSQNPIVAPTPTTAPPVAADTDTTPAGTGGVHVVQPGDTLSGIAAAYGISMQAIADANGLVDVDNLTAGDELQIPPTG